MQDSRYMTELEAMYTQHVEGTAADVRSGVVCYRTRTIKSGDMLECISYPVYKKPSTVRGMREKATGAAQAEVNRRNAVRRMERLVQCNFGKSAVIVTCTYEGMHPEEEEAEKQLDLYLARLRRAAKKQGQELKYVAVTEKSSTGRVHHHMILQGVDRDIAESKWKRGYCNARRYQQRTEQFIGIVRYMLKYRSTQDMLVSKRIRASHNMVRPVETVSDHKLSIRKMERMAEDMQDQGMQILGKVYPQYEMHERPTIRTSEFMPGAYLYARMWKRED